MEIAALVGYHINKQYKIGKKLGAGAFGEIYQADQGNQSFAVKIEKSDTKHPQLQFEFKLYQYLNMHQAIGIPKVYGLYNENGFTFLVMELLGKSLEDIFTDSDRRFMLQTVAVMGLQMLECIEFLHVKQFLHRDIKPDNFLMGRQHYDRVYMVDFGLAKRYITKDTHITYKENKALTGTARYASINTHLGIEQSRRDDLESLGYVLMYFLRGQLPWQNLKASTQREKYERIMEKKLATSSQALCRGYPQQLCDFIEYSKSLKFDDKPDYRMLKQLFSSMMKENQLRMEYFYDWDDEDTQREKLIIDDRMPTLPKEKKSTSIGSIGRTILKTNQNQIQNHINVSTIQVRPSNKLSGARQILRKHSSMHKS